MRTPGRKFSCQVVKYVTCGKSKEVKYRERQQLDRKVYYKVFMLVVPIEIFFMLGCTTTVVWPAGLRNYDKNFLVNLATKMYLRTL